MKLDRQAGLVKLPLAGSADDASRQRDKDGELSGERLRGWVQWRRAALGVLYQYLDIVLGAVLTLAGVLKARQLLENPLVGRAGGLPRWLLFCVAAFELGFGLWLLAGLYRRATRWLCLLWFTSLAAVALAQALGGVASCACFGDLHTHPLLMFLFDGTAVVLLWNWTPRDHCSSNRASSRWRLPLILALALLAAVGLIGLAGAAPNRPVVAEITLGNTAQGGETQQAFRCINDSGEFMEVASIETSCACATISLERPGVPPGQSLAGTVKLDLRQKPEFVGNLVIEARGLTRRGRVAFLIETRATVYPVAMPASARQRSVRQ